MSPAPPLTPPEQLAHQLSSVGWAVLDAASVTALTQVDAGTLGAWESCWDDLPPDKHLLDGGRYRYRRHGSFVVDQGVTHHVPHRAHWQPVAYNALHGGIERWFDPMPASWTGQRAWHGFLAAWAGVAQSLPRRGSCQVWYSEAHPFRITTEGGIGRPTPEGAHRDGVDLVVVLMVARHQIKGGETRVFDAQGPAGVRFTLLEPWSALILDDARVIHESTPIQALGNPGLAYRDTLVLTFRSDGFQDPK